MSRCCRKRSEWWRFNLDWMGGNVHYFEVLSAKARDPKLSPKSAWQRHRKIFSGKGMLCFFLEYCNFETCQFNPLQPSFAFHVETSHLICTTNQMTGYYMKCNTGLKWVDWFFRCLCLSKCYFLCQGFIHLVRTQNFPKNLHFTSWYAHVRTCIRG